ncbi:glycosyltransferase [Nocardioides luteus]|uniref:Glycosyl transferase n=1 Tax=Nocardioides luteus TaxID=1844 RepID=A0A1J4N9U9_9ACTN|nr:glycosyltransferase [Nocardioides luteus]OIJ27416.1 glycosyl transferase [Nocardioides luteus]
MRVALVSEHANPLAALGGEDAGGQNVHVAALAAGLADDGHEVTVYTRRDDLSTPARVRTDGYVVEHVPAGPPAEVAKDDLLPYIPELARRLQEAWLLEPPDLVHTHFWMSGLASLAGVRELGVPLVQSFHALGSVKRRQQGSADTSPPERIGHERRLCVEADTVIATCTDEVRELRRLGLPDGRATVIPCGVDTDRFRPGPGVLADRLRLLVLGRMVPRKGIGNVIEALGRLVHDEGLDVELVIAGGPARRDLDSDPEAMRLREIAAHHRVADRTIFLGSADRDDVPGLIRSSDAVVSVPWYEPFGIVPLEAMACGRPVVGTAVGGLLDTVVPGVTGDLVTPRRPDELARVLATLLRDPERRRRYGDAGRRRAVERYDWRHVLAATEDLYERVTRTARSPRSRRSNGAIDAKEAVR